MKRRIVMTGINEVSALANEASKVNGDIILSRGRIAVDAKSLMGIISIDVSQGVDIEFPEDNEEFYKFIEPFFV